MEKPKCFGSLDISDKPCAICVFHKSCRQEFINVEDGNYVVKTAIALQGGKKFSVKGIKAALHKNMPSASDEEIAKILTRISLHPNIVVVKSGDTTFFKARETAGEIM